MCIIMFLSPQVHVVGPAVERPVEVFKPTYFTADFKGLEPGMMEDLGRTW